MTSLRSKTIKELIRSIHSKSKRNRRNRNIKMKTYLLVIIFLTLCSLYKHVDTFKLNENTTTEIQEEKNQTLTDETFQTKEKEEEEDNRQEEVALNEGGLKLIPHPQARGRGGGGRSRGGGRRYRPKGGSGNSGELGGGEISGIVIGCIFGVMLLIFLIAYCCD